MPSLKDCYPGLIDVLARQEASSRPGPETRPGWEAVLRIAVTRASGESLSRRVVAALDGAGMMEACALAGTPIGEILDLLAQAGVDAPPRIAALIHRLARWFSASFPDTSAVEPGNGPVTPALREELLAINGIGQGTTDAILLALGRSSFPIDPGVYRILVRHGWCDLTADYDEASETLRRHAGDNPSELARLANGLSSVGRRYCGVRAPRCDRCPLLPLLPPSGPIDPHG
ncbi:MAG: hypothetical protein U0790_26205 [Isosphaeraceae bacterium]